MTAAELKEYTLKDLGQMAKKKGVVGWHGMRKDQLVRALVKATRRKPASSRRKATTTSRRKATTASAKRKKSASVARTRQTKKKTVSARRGTSSAKKSSRAAVRPKNPTVARRVQKVKKKIERLRNLAQEGNGRQRKDRLVVMVRGPFWLHAHWEITRQSVERAEAAMGQQWHGAKPILRLLVVSGSGVTSTTERVVQDIEIHGGVNNWYVHVQDSPKTYRMDIGYLSTSGKFFALSRSNVVTTPRAGARDSVDNHWNDVAEDFEKIYAMSGGRANSGASSELRELFEERLRRPMSSPSLPQYAGNGNGQRPRDFSLDVDAELIVYGATDSEAGVTLQGEPVRLRADGTFTMRFSMPNCRQVIPIVARSGDGAEQRTIVLAVERNTKVMEPIVRDEND